MNTSVGRGLQTYGDALADAGGSELQTVQSCGDTLAVGLYASPPYSLNVPPLGVARLSINLSRASVFGGLDGEPRQSFTARRHSLFLTPASAGAHWRKASDSRHINIYFDRRAFDADDAGASEPLLGDAAPMLNAGPSGAGPFFDMLVAELAAPHAFRAEAVDALARLILLRLTRRQAGGAARANPVTPALRGRLTEHVLARLDQRLPVADLAAVAGLGANRFTEAFTSATGQTPHQFVLRLRLERAVQLLQGSSLALADVAAVCGFASQQHLTQVMRRRRGTTPARLRAATAGGLDVERA